MLYNSDLLNLADECYIHLKYTIEISLQNVKLRQQKQVSHQRETQYPNPLFST